MEQHPLRLVRAVRALDGMGAEPSPAGVLLPGGPLVDWEDVAQALGDDDPIAPAPRVRLTLLLRLRGLVHALGPGAGTAILQAARPLALPPGHALHPGPRWIREPVPGGLLDLGLGVSGLLPGQDSVIPVPPSVVAACGVTAEDAWAGLLPLVERLGGFALDRLEGPAHEPSAVTGVGGCDALTLLALAPVRQGLQADHRPGPFSAPSRDRVWVGAAAADHAYVRAVWILTAPAHRGLLEPMTVGSSGIVPHPARPQAHPPHRDHAT